VNRLPDGTWIAICRNDKGNYHFTTSTDGRTYGPLGKPMPHVPKWCQQQTDLRPLSAIIYYLGWQEATKIQGVNRSVFNHRYFSRWEIMAAEVSFRNAEVVPISYLSRTPGNDLVVL
jgi:hypothetical protein